jgi:hypothetical protein
MIVDLIMVSVSIKPLHYFHPLKQVQQLLACDLEADSMHHYREQVCLLQISTGTQNFIIDPLACPDFSPLAPLFADPAIVKIPLRLPPGVIPTLSLTTSF